MYQPQGAGNPVLGLRTVQHECVGRCWQQDIHQHQAQQFPAFRIVLAVLQGYSFGPRANVVPLCGRGAVEHAPEA